ncbi:hypothetical protein CRE_29343 [Caenorhabditis remanei]|uniref:F-box domain-containing protein n=1 Tax=Caenorhabditis remanei TaxID=31234 RepID=E3MY00_CAERE|nr:hypothetical protein CRE_29343 [Caenorhabditis remanei]
MTSSFPLLNLPSEAILHVLKSMDYGEFITISLLSKRAKQAVESMNLYCRHASVVISDSIILFMSRDSTHVKLNFTMDNVSDERTNGSLSLPDTVKLKIYTIGSQEMKWSIKGICIKTWINHFKAVFHFSKFDLLRFDENTSRFDIEELQTTLRTIGVLYILSDNGWDVKSILKHFPARRLWFNNDVFKRLGNPHSVLIQNYDDLEIFPEFELPNTLDLDDLLTTNSKTIDIHGLDWTEKELNRFLKHWIKGSNPRMEKLSISLFSLKASNKFNILKGIKCMEMPADHTRWFKSCNGSVETVTGGYDFYRRDGTKATINFWEFGMGEMYVWYSHCVGKEEEMGN